jgi:hypothetical protein
LHRRPISAWPALLVCAALVSFAGKATLALTTYGSNDVLTWEADLAKIRSDGALALYRDGIVLYHGAVPYHSEVFNHPPFMVRVISLWGWLADVSGLPLRFWLRLTSAIADLASLLLAGRILRRWAPLVMMALAPVSLFVSGFHGNTDPIMIALLLLSVYLIAEGRPDWTAGAALGMALSIKIVPVLFLPAFYFFLRGRRRRLEFLASAAAVFVAASLPFIFMNPVLILKNIFTYGSNFGFWGFPIIAAAVKFKTGFQWLPSIYALTAKFAMIWLLAVAAIWMNASGRKPPLFLQCAFLAVCTIFLTPGFGVQYLAWLVPWTVCLRPWQAFTFHLTSGTFLFAYYNGLCGGMPWRLADSVGKIAWSGPVVHLGLVCWLATGVMAVFCARLILRSNTRTSTAPYAARRVCANPAPARNCESQETQAGPENDRRAITAMVSRPGSNPAASRST